MSDAPIPTVSISLTVKDAADALEFYKKAFGINELYRMEDPDGSVGHAEFEIGNTRLYISGEYPDWKAYQLPDGVLSPSLLTIGTKDCDVAFKKAIDAGAECISEPQDYFWGMRAAFVKDPYGYRWSLGQNIEQLSIEEVEQRSKEVS